MKAEVKKGLQAESTNGRGTVPSEGTYRSQAERRAEGKALREAVICDFAGDYADRAERDHKAS
jgi:hypothetical protein